MLFDEDDVDLKNEINQLFKNKNVKSKILKNEDQDPKSTTQLYLKEKLLLCSLVKFYSDPINKKFIIPIIKQETSISLRLLDWLVTNYSKKNNIHYKLGPELSNGYIPSHRNFNLWLDYKNQLKAHSKRKFDPFCRRQRILFNVITNETTLLDIDEYSLYANSENFIVTTIGQLNFMKWAIENRVIDYAFDHIQEIESDMLSSADKRSVKKGRRSLSKNIQNAKTHELKVVIQFL